MVRASSRRALRCVLLALVVLGAGACGGKDSGGDIILPGGTAPLRAGVTTTTHP